MTTFHEEAAGLLDALPEGVRTVATDRASLTPADTDRYVAVLAIVQEHRRNTEIMQSLITKLSSGLDALAEPVSTILANVDQFRDLNDHRAVMALIGGR